MSETIARQLKIEEFPFEIKDKLGNVIYMEYEDGEWFKRKFNDQGLKIYYERSDGYWINQKYDEEGFEIYYENSDGYKKGDLLKAEQCHIADVVRELPSPECDEACYYHCTKGGEQPPDCVK